MSKGRIAAFVVVAALVAAFFVLDLRQYLSLEYVKSQSAALGAAVRANPWQAAAAFFLVYVAVTGLSVPGAAVLSVAAGALFGWAWGAVIVSFAAAIGATIAFLVSRFLLRDWVRARLGDRAAPIEAGIARDGIFYLLTLRLLPQVPFFVVNLVMGLTALPARTFYWVSQLGMLPGCLAYTYAGTQLARVQSLKDVLSPGLIAAFTAIGLLPIAAKFALHALHARRVYARWPRPARFERNVVVIGAGSAGLVAAYIAATVKAKVTLVEKHRMGGDCLNTGCVPSKALIRSTRLLAQMRRSQELGIRAARAEFDFAEVMERVDRVVKQVEPHDSPERYAALGVECVAGEARIASPWTVEVALADGSRRTYTTRNIVIAAGARPFVPPIPGLAEASPLTSDTVWSLRRLPPRLAVLGGGPIGCELAQCFARLGSRVTQVEMLPRLLAREDPEFSELVARRFRDEGVEVRTGCKLEEVRVENGEKVLVVRHAGGEERIACDEILCAVGRAANTQGYGLEELGIPVTAQKTVEVNEYLQTAYPNIYACGDVAGPYQFTHTASHMAWYCAVNALFGGLRRFRVDYSVVPWVTFTEPEVARVGLSETEAKEKNIPYQVSTYRLDELDRAIADGAAEGLVKVLTRPGSDRILGATVAGEHAGEFIVEFVAAMRHGFGLNRILGTIHAYPTMAEANKYAAGVWRRHRVTHGQVALAGAYNDWSRGEAGLGRVLAKVFALGDKRPYYGVAESHAD